MRNNKVFLFLFLVLNGCGNHEPKPVKQVVENNISKNNQQQINKEILDQLRDLREQTIELRNQISSRKSENATCFGFQILFLNNKFINMIIV